MDQHRLSSEEFTAMYPWMERGQTSSQRTLMPAASGASLVGRQRDLDVLLGRFAAAEAGNAGLVLATGEPGIGKTSLLKEAARQIAARGALVLHGDASEAEGMPPYLPFLEMLGDYIRAADSDQLRAEVGEAGPILAGILPELVARLGELPQQYPLPAEQARLRLYEAVSAFLTAIAASRPLVLILDDLHWADAASLDLLFHIVRRQRSARLLIIGSYRKDEGERNPALAHIEAELNRLRLLTTVTLGSLSPADIALIAAGYVGRPVAPDVNRLLYAQSEGNPFFAEELLLGWIESGALAEEIPLHTLLKRLESRLPPGIVAAVSQRLAGLKPEVVGELRVAAIIGRTFDATLLAAVQGTNVAEVEDRLLEAARARLIQSYRADTFIFSHDKIRECLYAEVGATRRKQLHAVIGQSLEAHTDTEDAQQLATLAFHFSHSGDRARGAAYSLRAARAALDAYAAESAMAHFRVALELLDPSDRQRGDLYLHLGEAALLSGDEREAVAAYTAARDWWTQAGAPLIAARAAHGLGVAHWRLRELPKAQASFETALGLLANRKAPETVRAEVALATLLGVSLGAQTEGIVHGYRALEMARALGRDDLEAAASRVVGNLLARENALPAGIALQEQALALAIAADDLTEAAECCASLVESYFWSGDVSRAREINDRQESLARSAHDPYLLRHVYSWRAFLHACQGEWTDVESLLAQAQRVVEQFASTEPVTVLHQMRGLLAYLRGDNATAMRELRSAMTTLLAQDPGKAITCRGALGLATQAAGEERQARDIVTDMEASVAAGGAGNMLSTGTMALGTALNCLALMAIAMHDYERLAAYYPRLLAFQGQYHLFLVDRVLAAIEVRQGNWASAEARLERAAATARRENLRLEMPHIFMGRAELEAMRGGPESDARSRQALAAALGLFEENGLVGEASRAKERIEALSSRPGIVARTVAAPRAANPDGLSDREIAVLRLVASGMSNRQIAEELFLSEKTVANHLTAIFGKTGTNNRAGAAALALRNGLV